MQTGEEKRRYKGRKCRDNHKKEIFVEYVKFLQDMPESGRIFLPLVDFAVRMAYTVEYSQTGTVP